jgi:phospholipid transport system substrate-binding protein
MTRTLRTILLALAVAAGPQAARADDAPTQVVQGTTQQLQALIQERRAEFLADRSRFYAAVDAVVAPAFDLPYISRAVLGRSWRTASDEQRGRFQAAFKTSLIRTYADALLEHGESARVEWLGATTDEEGATVRANLIRDGAGAPVAVAFTLHRGDAGRWQVYDLAVESVSLLTNFRSQVAAEIRRSGVDAMIQRMEAAPTLASRS